MKVSFLAGLGPLVREPERSLAFYRDVLGLPLVGDGYTPWLHEQSAGEPQPS